MVVLVVIFFWMKEVGRGGVIKGDGAGEKLSQYPLLLNSASEIKMTFPNNINFVTR